MKKILFSCALAGALFGLEIDGFSAPSGSLITDDAFYIANRGSSEDPQERDGFISRIVKNSNVVETNFIDDLVNPGGMAQIADEAARNPEMSQQVFTAQDVEYENSAAFYMYCLAAVLLLGAWVYSYFRKRSLRRG